MPEIDLNLLRIFDALMEFRSVTGAARHIGVTQSAVSHALARLRNALDDPLFLRGPSGLQPTARAEEMASAVRLGLVHFREALARTGFDPAQEERHFTIAAGAYFCTLLVPALVERIRSEAPGISLQIVPVTEMLPSLLDRGAVDLALGATVEAPTRLVVEPLYEEEMVWIASLENPIAQFPADAAQLLEQPRVLLAPGQPFEAAGRSAGDQIIPRELREWGAAVSSRDSITVYDSQTAVAIIARTNLVALVPRKVATHALARDTIRVLDPPAGTQPFGLSMIWHARQRSDAGLEWLRSRIREAMLPADDRP